MINQKVAVNSSRFRFAISLLLSVNIHIFLFLLISSRQPKCSSLTPRVIYHQQTSLFLRKEGKVEAKKKREGEVSVKKKSLSARLAEGKKIDTKREREEKRRGKKVKWRRKTRMEKGEIEVERSGREKQVWEDYYRVISRRIKEQAVYPEEARQRKEEGLVYLSFVLSKDGHLEEVKVRISSGYEKLDRAALESIKKASPFPAFPKQIKEKRLVLNIPISFEIK